MAQDFYNDGISEPMVRETIIKITGAGAANPTVNFGHGVLVTRVTTGQYRVTFQEAQYKLIGISGWCIESTTMTDVKGYNIAALTPSSAVPAKPTFDFTVYTSGFAAVDLTLVQSLTLRILNKHTGV